MASPLVISLLIPLQLRKKASNTMKLVLDSALQPSQQTHEHYNLSTHGKTLYTTTLTNPHNTYTQTNHNIPYYTLYNLHIYTQYELFQLFVYGALCFIVGICIGIFRNSLYSVWKKYFCCFTVCFKACSPNSGTTSVYSSELQISGTSTHNMTSYGLKEREEDSNL